MWNMRFLSLAWRFYLFHNFIFYIFICSLISISVIIFRKTIMQGVIEKELEESSSILNYGDISIMQGVMEK